MRVVEGICEDCRTEFKVKRKRGIPPWKIVCPYCESKSITIVKINGDDLYED